MARDDHSVLHFGQRGRLMRAGSIKEFLAVGCRLLEEAADKPIKVYIYHSCTPPE